MSQRLQSQNMQEGVNIDTQALMRLRSQAKSLKLANFQTARSSKSGGRVSRFRGRGMDYVESRRYLPGDDIRTMDWRVTARSGIAHSKVFQEERERPVYVVVDFSDSLFFGSRVAFKSVIAAKVATLLGWATIQNGDRIGATLALRNGLSDAIQNVPAAGGVRAMSILTRVFANATRAEKQSIDDTNSNFQAALREARRHAPHGSLLFVISDFYALSTAVSAQLDGLRRQHELFACRILDPLEKFPPPPGEYLVSDGNNRATLNTRTHNRRVSLQEKLALRNQHTEQQLLKSGVRLIDLQTSDDVVAALKRGLGTGRARKNSEPLPLASPPADHSNISTLAAK